MRINNFNLISNVVKILDEKKLTFYDLDKKLDLPMGTVESWVDDNSIPSKYIPDILNLFNLTPNELLYSKDQLIQSYHAYFDDKDMNKLFMSKNLTLYSKLLNIRFSILTILVITFCISLYVNFLFSITNVGMHISSCVTVLLSQTLFYIFTPRKKIYINYKDNIYYRLTDTTFLYRDKLKKTLKLSMITITLTIIYLLYNFIIDHSYSDFYLLNLLFFCLLFVLHLYFLYIPLKLRETLNISFMNIVNKHIGLCMIITAIYGSIFVYLLENELILLFIYPIVFILNFYMCYIYKINYAKYQLVLETENKEIKKINL